MGGDCFNVDVIQINVNTLVEDGSCNQGTLTFTGFISGDPQLDALADNDGLSAGLTTSPQVIQTMALLPDSPAIDAGDDATCEPSDQRGQSREGTCDIGAFEWQGQGSEVYLPLVIKN
jgi:hypothetical protein